MTRLELEQYVDRPAVWHPVLRSADGALAVPVNVEAVRQRYGRNETRIHPVHGHGAAWVSAASVRLQVPDPNGRGERPGPKNA